MFIISIVFFIVVSARTYKDNIVSDNIELLVDSIEEKEIASISDNQRIANYFTEIANYKYINSKFGDNVESIDIEDYQYYTEEIENGDVVLTDNNYIYSMSTKYKNIEIMKVNGKSIEKISAIDFLSDSNINKDCNTTNYQMHLSGTKLIVLFTEYKQVVRNDDLLSSKIQMMNYNESSTIIVYDISNIIRPKIIKQVMVDGSLLDTKPIILKFAYSDGKLKPLVKTKIEGLLTDISCVDEYNGYFRSVFNKNGSTNLIYNIDENLNIVGEAVEIAREGYVYIGYFQENMGCFRMSGNYGEYLCTVDFSNPEKIEIMSELKIDGYS